MSREGYRLAGAGKESPPHAYDATVLATERADARLEHRDQPIDSDINRRALELKSRQEGLIREARVYQAFKSALALGGRQLYEIYGTEFFKAAIDAYTEWQDDLRAKKYVSGVSIYDVICKLEPNSEARLKLYDLMDRKAAQARKVNELLHMSRDQDLIEESEARKDGVEDVEWDRVSQLRFKLAMGVYRKLDDPEGNHGTKTIMKMLSDTLATDRGQYIPRMFDSDGLASISPRIMQNFERMYKDSNDDIEHALTSWDEWMRERKDALDSDSKTFRDEVRAKMDELIRPIEERYMEKMLALTKRLEDIDNEPAVIEARRAKTNPFSADTAEQFDVLLEERLNRANTQRDQTLNSIPQIEKEMDRLVSQMRVELKNATWKYRQLLETMRDNKDVQSDISKGRYAYNDRNPFTYY